MKAVNKGNIAGKILMSLCIVTITTLSAITSVGQNLTERNLSGNNGTGSGWHGQGWFWIIGMIILAVLVWVISIDRTKRRLDCRKYSPHLKKVM